jgi:hypothetical protein
MSKLLVCFTGVLSVLMVRSASGQATFTITQGAAQTGASAAAVETITGTSGGAASGATSNGNAGASGIIMLGNGSAGGATSGTGGAGGDFSVTTGSGGGATSGTSGRGGNAIFNLSSAGATGTPGAPGQFRIVGGTVAGTNTTPFLSITGIWNTPTGVVDAGIFENITNNASAAGSKLIDLQVGSSPAISEFNVDVGGNAMANMSMNTPLYTSPASPGPLTIKPGADSAQAIIFKNSSGATTAVSIDTIHQYLGIGSASAPTQAFDVGGGKFVVNNNGVPINSNTQALAGYGFDTILYATATGPTNLSQGPISMTSGISGTHWFEFTVAIAQSDAGATCTGPGNVDVSLTFTDPSQSSPYNQFVPLETLGSLVLIHTLPLINGSLSILNLGSGHFRFSAKTSTSISFSTTYNPGMGCSAGTTGQKYIVYPELRIIA